MKEKHIKKDIKVTPVMKQYWEAKSSYPDSIMLFRMGDFYETFENDAKIASKILGITLTKRANGAASSVPLAGFPYHAYDQYVHKLLESGYKVALCEQIEDPKTSKGIVKRKVVELLTPGTAINNAYLEQNKNNYILSIFFANDYLGFSVLDNSTGEMFCGETNSKNINDIILRYDINEILVCENQKHILQSMIKSDIMITIYENWKANISISYKGLIEQFKTKSLKGFGIENKDLAVIATNTCIDYIKENSFGKTSHINSLTKIEDDGYMHIDSFTMRNLEVFDALNSRNEKGTLFKVINNTCTSSGARLLRVHLYRPLTKINAINKRLNTIKELINSNEILENIRAFLNEVSDIERILGKISNDKANPRDIINLGISIKLLDKIKKEAKSKTKNLVILINKKNNLSKISSSILKTIKKDPGVNISKGNYINSGVNKELDNLRLISNKVSNWLINYQTELRTKNNIPNLKISYNKVFGYYIDVTNSHISKIPNNFIRKQTLTNSERYYTAELKTYEEKILTAESKIIEIEKNILDKLNQKIMLECDKIQHNAKILSQIDVFCSHAITATNNKYTKPIVKNNSSYILKKSRHPVVEKLLPLNEEFIANDLSLNDKDRKIAIITGPNMAGKSTYLRQVALISLLAQIGSYVPCNQCELGIVDKLYTRVGASDNLVGGESTFLVEMNETANILNNSTNKSLIILDEIGRGTSTFDGISLAWAITEYIHNNKSKKARTLFATHYHELIYLADKLSSCFNLNIEVKEYNDEIIFLRKIKEGGTNKSYGIHVAEMAGLPSNIIKRSKHLLDNFTKNKTIGSKFKVKKTGSNDKQLGLFNKKETRLISELKKIDLNNVSPIEALNLLNNLKKIV